MADVEGNYYQAVDTQPIPRGPWFRACSIFVGGLLLLAGVVTVTSMAAPPNPRSSDPSELFANLVHQPRVVRAIAQSKLGNGAVPRAVEKLQKYGFSPGPLERFALMEIDANNRGDRLRDVSMKAEASEEASREAAPAFAGKETLDKMKDQAEAGTLGLETMETIQEEKMRALGKERKVDPKEMPGVTEPLGFWDPLGFSTDCSTSKLLFYREVELKHGRVCMLASLGFLVAEQFHPLFGGDINVPSYIAFQATPLKQFWPAVLAAMAIPELFSIGTFNEPFGDPMDPRVGWWTIKEYHISGDLGFDPLGLRPKTKQEYKEMATKELNNGRLAMIATAGMIAQELATGKKLFG